MGNLRIPQNKIQFKYTIGNEYIYANSYKDYQGHYYEVNNSFFAGKEFKINALVLIKKDSSNINLLKLNPKTTEYANISGASLTINKIISIPYSNKEELNSSDEDNPSPQFFCKKLNEKNISIKRINEETYTSLLKNPLYQTTFIGTYNNIIQSPITANKQLPGLLIFISS